MHYSHTECGSFIVHFKLMLFERNVFKIYLLLSFRTELAFNSTKCFFLRLSDFYSLWVIVSMQSQIIMFAFCEAEFVQTCPFLTWLPSRTDQDEYLMCSTYFRFKLNEFQPIVTLNTASVSKVGGLCVTSQTI